MWTWRGVGITRPNLTGLPTTMIRSYWELGDILHFDPDTAQSRNMELGYYDTLRAFGRVRGCAYAVDNGADSSADAAAFRARFDAVQKAVREKYPVTLTADAALTAGPDEGRPSLPRWKPPPRTPGVDPTCTTPPGRWGRRFWTNCDRDAHGRVRPAVCTGSSGPRAGRRWPPCCPIHSCRRWCGRPLTAPELAGGDRR